MSAAPIGGSMTAGALMLLDSKSQPHCLWPSRPSSAHQVCLSSNLTAMHMGGVCWSLRHAELTWLLVDTSAIISDAVQKQLLPVHLLPAS